MGVDVHIPANEVWSFFQKNKDRLTEEMVAIAENTDTEYAVYLTEDYGYPTFFVCKGDLPPEYEEGAINPKDCEQTAKKCYAQYLYPVQVNSEKSFPPFPPEEDDSSLALQRMKDEEYEREDELRLALCDFLQVVIIDLEDGVDIESYYGPGIIDEILDYFLEYLGFEQRLPVYRPMFITDDETGEEVYTEYPYDMDGLYECDDTDGETK